jgi:hypothetical protein
MLMVMTEASETKQDAGPVQEHGKDGARSPDMRQRQGRENGTSSIRKKQ